MERKWLFKISEDLKSDERYEDESSILATIRSKCITQLLPLGVIDSIQSIMSGLLLLSDMVPSLAPSTTAVIAGFIVGLVPILRMLLIGTTAPLHVVHDSASILGDAAIPAVTLIIGANLLRGLKGTGIHLWVVIGIAAIHYIFLPLVGIVVVKGAIYLGHSDPLYQVLFQYLHSWCSLCFEQLDSLRCQDLQVLDFNLQGCSIPTPPFMVFPVF